MKHAYFLVTLLAVIMATISACSKPSPPAATPSALVKLTTATTGTVTDTLTVYGDVSADLSGQQDLVAPVEALIKSIAAPLGSSVQAGSVVATLSPSPATSVVIAQAAASANQADAAYDRAKRLRADGLVGDAEVETAKAAAESADTALASLRGRGLVLKSPVEGTVTSIGFATGDLVTAGATVAVVTVDGDVRARFGIDPTLARRVSAGDPIRIAPSSGGTALNEKVIAIDPVVDPVTRLASIFAVIPAAAKISAGEPLQAEITISRTENAVTIPYAAVLNDGGQSYVYTVKNGIAQRADIVIGGKSGDLIAVLSGVAAGDAVVTTGAAGVSDGLAVRTEAPNSGSAKSSSGGSSPPSAASPQSSKPPQAASK